jgi:Helix-turn-helix domain
MELSTSGISTTKAAKRLNVTPATVRRWCETSGFGIRLMGRWRIPENRIAEIERNLSDAGMPSCRASRG